MAIFTNRAFLTYNNITTGSNIATGEILEVLSAAMTALIDEYTLGDRITYIVSLVNSGPTALTALTLTDNLGAYENGDTTLYPLTFVPNSVKYYVNGVLQAPPTVTAETALTVSGISIPAGGNAVIAYAADVNAFAPLAEGETIVDAATVSGAGVNPPITVTESISATVAPALTITKSISPATVTENSRVTYTFVIQNYGSREAAATDNLTVTDTFDPILTDLVVTLDGETLQADTDYTYNAETGQFTTAVSRITVPAATFTRDPETGAIVTEPGTAVLTVTGTI